MNVYGLIDNAFLSIVSLVYSYFAVNGTNVLLIRIIWLYWKLQVVVQKKQKPIKKNKITAEKLSSRLLKSEHISNQIVFYLKLFKSFRRHSDMPT